MRKLMLLVGVLAVACEGPDHGSGFVEDRGLASSPVDAGNPAPDAGSCGGDEAACSTDADCCHGFCTWTFISYTEQWSGCAQPQENGAYCEAPSWCQSGLCVEGTCVAEVPECVALAEQCFYASDCCQGFCTNSAPYSVYGIGQCSLPLEDGAFCDAASWCRSGHCVDGTCVTPPTECVPAGEACNLGEDTCCDGFCYGAYIRGRCIQRVQDGEHCGTSEECASNNCGDGRCRAAECVAPESQCWSDTECCTGFCTYTGFDYSPGQCAAPQPAGAACQADQWCQNFSCLDGVCH